MVFRGEESVLARIFEGSIQAASLLTSIRSPRMAINSDSLDVPVYTRLLRRRPPSSSAGLVRSLAFPASSVYILSP